MTEQILPQNLWRAVQLVLRERRFGWVNVNAWSTKKSTHLPYILSVPWWIPETFMLTADMSQSNRRWEKCLRTGWVKSTWGSMWVLMLSFNPHSARMFLRSTVWYENVLWCYTQTTGWCVQRYWSKDFSMTQLFLKNMLCLIPVQVYEHWINSLFNTKFTKYLGLIPLWFKAKWYKKHCWHNYFH